MQNAARRQRRGAGQETARAGMCGHAEERDPDVAPVAERPVRLERHHLAAPERRHQSHADAGMGARHESHSVAIAAHPAPELGRLFRRHDDVSSTREAVRQEAPGQLPVYRHAPSPTRCRRQVVDCSAPVTIRRGGEARGRLTIRGDQVGKAHREIAEEGDGEPSSRPTEAPVINASASRLARRSVGRKRGASRPTCRASVSRSPRGRTLSVAASRYSAARR